MLAGISCCAFGQIPTVIQIDIENYAYYYADNPDYTKLAGSLQAVPPISTKTFSALSGWRTCPGKWKTSQRHVVDSRHHHKLHANSATGTSDRRHDAELLC